MSKTIMVKGKPYIIPDGVRGITQEEYNKLSDEEKQGLWVITDREPVAGNPQNYKNMEIYSTEEIMIGVYKDKPLYSKTYICGASSGAANLTLDTRLDIEAIVEYSGFVSKPPYITALPYYASGSSVICGVALDTGSGKLYLGLLGPYATISGAEVTVKYTKKDDTLASIMAND